MEEIQLTRLSVNMNAETAESLDTLSKIQSVSKTEIIRRAVALMRFIEDEQRRGRRVVTMDHRDKHWRELVLV